MSNSPRHSGTRFADKSSSSDNKSDNNKKKIIVYCVVGVLLAAAVVALVFVVLAGIRNGGNDNSLHTEGTRHDVTVAPNGGASGEEFTGIWVLDDITAYEFDGKGNGILHASKDFTFAYSAANGVLFVDYDTDDAHDSSFEYSISGQQLTMKRNGQTYILYKELD